VLAFRSKIKMAQQSNNSCPKFIIAWFDEGFLHLKTTIDKLHTVLFNCEVKTFTFPKDESLPFQTKQIMINALNEGENDNHLLGHNHLIAITSRGGDRDFGIQVLQSAMELKNEHQNLSSQIRTCIYSGSIMKDSQKQNQYLKAYNADFVASKLNCPSNCSPMQYLETFIVQYYQQVYYPILIQWMKDTIVTDGSISPDNSAITKYMVLKKEEEIKQSGTHDHMLELIPLRKIVHNLHMNSSSICLSPFLNQCQQYVVFISTGGLNPVHTMHINVFECARNFVENYDNISMALNQKQLTSQMLDKQRRPLKVVGGFISPSHETYIQSKLQKKKETLCFSSEERILLCDAACANDPFVCTFPWECKQPSFVSFSRVANTCSMYLRSPTCPIGILMPTNPLTHKLQDYSFIKVAYLCGADLIVRAPGGIQRFDYADGDMFTVAVGRAGSSLESINIINGTLGTIPIYFVPSSDEDDTDLSSTNVRQYLGIIHSKSEKVSNEERTLALNKLSHIVPAPVFQLLTDGNLPSINTIR